MEHFQKDDASILSLKKYLDFLVTEELIDFHDNYGITGKDFEVICRSKEATELAGRMVLRFASDPRVDHLRCLISSTLDAAQLQRVFLKHLIGGAIETLSNILWALDYDENASETITTENNPYFKQFIEKFSELNASDESLVCINELIILLVQQVNDKIKEENDSESEEYPLPIIYLNKGFTPTEELLFPSQ